MYFEIIETYPAELFDSTLRFLKIPVQIGKDKEKREECVKLILKNDDKGSESYEIIESFLEFCESTLNFKNNDSETSSITFDLNTLELNAFIKTTFRTIPETAQIVVEKETPNEMKIVFSHSSSSVTNISMKICISTFYFIFSSLINIRNYVDYNSLSFDSPLKNQIMRMKMRVDKLFDELILSDIFIGSYESRLARVSDSVRKDEQTVLSAIKNISRYYGVKSHSMFTVNDYIFMLIEHSEFGEVSLFEYQFKSKIYKINS